MNSRRLAECAQILIVMVINFVAPPIESSSDEYEGGGGAERVPTRQRNAFKRKLNNNHYLSLLYNYSVSTQKLMHYGYSSVLSIRLYR